MAQIVHFGKYYSPDLGGIESVTLSIAKGAVSAGHAVTVICFEKTPAPQEEVLDGVSVVRVPIEKLVSSQPLGLKYFSKCLSIARGSDIVHLHAPNMLGALCALLINRKTRLLVHWHSDVINKGCLGSLIRPLEWALLRRADCIVATSPVYANFSKTLGPFKKKIKIVPIGVPDAKPAGSDMTLPPHLEQRVKGSKIILAVGRLVPYKGFSTLIEAVKILSTNAVVVIAGGGPLENDLRKAVEVANVSGRVILTGRVSDAVLHALFDRATLYCLSSTDRAEAFGVVLLEAMAYGLPIVATKIPGSGVSWVNQHGITGFNVPVKEPICLARACNEILASSELRQRLGRNARQRFLSEFTENVSISRMLTIYDQLVVG